MDRLNYSNGIEHLFKYLKPEQFMSFASINQHSLSLVQDYFEAKEMPTFKTDGNVMELSHPLQYFYKIKLDDGEYVFRPTSVNRARGICMYGWIISGKKMLKTGERFRPYPWWFSIGHPYHAGGAIREHELSSHSPITKVIGRTTALTLA